MPCTGERPAATPWPRRPPPSAALSTPSSLVLSPEGTRDNPRHWRTGFYFIAQQAKVPIVLAYLDYGRKVAGRGLQFTHRKR